MNILYFWEPNGGLSLADRTNPYGPLLAAALQKQGITLEFGQYAFGKPVVLPRMGCLPELVDDTMGLLYNSKKKGALRAALKEIRNRDLKQAGQNAFERARSLNWDVIASRLAPLYRG